MPASHAISHYELLAKLGEGGMGVAYRARDLRLDRDVAIKVLHPDRGHDDLRRRRFVQEARAASSLNHPNIVTIYDIEEADGQDFIVMEYVPGKSLDQLIPRSGLPVAEALGYAIQVTSALSAAHAAGIIHRDIKPSNIVVEANGTAKVLDFGLAKLTAQDESGESLETRALGATTREGAIVGTAAYMSPEQAQAQKVDTRSDIFSLGVVLYEMLTGRRPFEGNNPISTIAAIIERDPLPPAQLEPRIPSELERVILRCLRKSPDRRFQHMADLKVALEELKDESASGRFKPLPRQKEGAKWRPLALAAFGFLLAFGFFWVEAPHVVPQPPFQNLKRLTFNGSSFGPDISKDGKLLAYSDVAVDRIPNIFVRQIASGSVVQITHEREGCTGWQFSPDGGHILYTTAANNAYEVPTLGGPSRLVATGARGAAYNLDGSGIVYLDERSILHMAQLDGTGAKVYLPDFMVAAGTVAPDSRQVLLMGIHNNSLDHDKRFWWLFNGGVLTPIVPPAVPEAAGEVPIPNAWYKDPDGSGRQWVVYSGRTGDSYNLFQSTFGTNGKVGPDVQRLTLSTGPATAARVSGTGLMVFSSGVLSTNLWRIPMDMSTGKVLGERENLTNLEGVPLRYASLSHDGRKAAYWIDGVVIVRDVPRSQFTRLASGDICSISPDGGTIAYQRPEKGTVAVYSSSAAGGVARKVVQDPAMAGLKGYSSDATHLLTQVYADAEGKGEVGLIDLQTGQLKRVLRHPTLSIWHPYYSWDDKWMTFLLKLDSDHYRVFITPVRDYVPAGQERWIPLTSGEYWDDKPQLSPSGNFLYFTSNRDGFYCVWQQRLNPLTKQPVGAPVAVQHLHNQRSVPFGAPPLYAMELSVARDGLVLALPDYRSDIWSLDLAKPSSRSADRK